MNKPRAVWVVRASLWDGMAEECWQKGCVGIRCEGLGDLQGLSTRDALRDAYRSAYPQSTPGQLAAALGVLWAFSHEISVGDWVVTPAGRELLVGKVTRGYRYSKAVLGARAPHVVDVDWMARLARDKLPNTLARRLQGRTTVYQLREAEKLVAMVSDRPLARVNAGAAQEVCALAATVSQAPWKHTEAATISKIIIPVLEKLGWDNINEIEHQYPVGKGAVDLALVRDGKPHVLVEAKPLGTQFTEAGSEVAQAIHYATDEGVEWAVLTDGARWWVYDPFLKAKNQTKRVLAIDLLGESAGGDPPEAIVLLTPASVLGGCLRQYASRALWFRAVKAALASPSEELLQALMKQAGLEADHETVKHVLAHFAQACPPLPLEANNC
ncbi:MAG: hypothetical protein N2512_03425 [Armatimonadetes bacterium]|nr:hypothetical protein [Armatimonadota bacterium]